jgi:hypothetical protein
VIHNHSHCSIVNHITHHHHHHHHPSSTTLPHHIKIIAGGNVIWAAPTKRAVLEANKLCLENLKKTSFIFNIHATHSSHLKRIKARETTQEKALRLKLIAEEREKRSKETAEQTAARLKSVAQAKKAEQKANKVIESKDQKAARLALAIQMKENAASAVNDSTKLSELRDKTIKSKDSDIAPALLQLAVGAVVMLKKNLSVPLGLVNGAVGCVYGFMYDKDKAATSPIVYSMSAAQLQKQSKSKSYQPQIPIVLVQFAADVYLGKSFHPSVPGIVPICATPSEISGVTDRLAKDGPETVGYTRFQLPLVLAWAVTIHKTQGRTVETLLLTPDECFARGMMYVAVSRVTSLKGLYLLSKLTKEMFLVRQGDLNLVTDEMNRLRGDELEKKTLEEARKLNKFVCPIIPAAPISSSSSSSSAMLLSPMRSPPQAHTRTPVSDVSSAGKERPRKKKPRIISPSPHTSSTSTSSSSSSSAIAALNDMPVKKLNFGRSKTAAPVQPNQNVLPGPVPTSKRGRTIQLPMKFRK